MQNIPLRAILIRIGGVAVMAVVLYTTLNWAFQTDPGGPFSDILSAIGVIGAVALGLVGGGMILAVGWLFDLFRDSNF